MSMSRGLYFWINTSRGPLLKKLGHGSESSSSAAESSSDESESSDDAEEGRSEAAGSGKMDANEVGEKEESEEQSHMSSSFHPTSSEGDAGKERDKAPKDLARMNTAGGFLSLDAMNALAGGLRRFYALLGLSLEFWNSRMRVHGSNSARAAPVSPTANLGRNAGTGLLKSLLKKRTRTATPTSRRRR